MATHARNSTKTLVAVLNASGMHGKSRMIPLIKTQKLLDQETGVKQDGGYGPLSLFQLCCYYAC